LGRKDKRQDELIHEALEEILRAVREQEAEWRLDDRIAYELRKERTPSTGG
jgi:hypothetical protein